MYTRLYNVIFRMINLRVVNILSERRFKHLPVIESFRNAFIFWYTIIITQIMRVFNDFGSDCKIG